MVRGVDGRSPWRNLCIESFGAHNFLTKILGVPLESGLCMYVYSLKIKTVRGLLHVAVKTSYGGVFMLVHGPHGSAGCLSIRALGFQVSIQSGNMRCLFLFPLFSEQVLKPLVSYPKLHPIQVLHHSSRQFWDCKGRMRIIRMYCYLVGKFRPLPWVLIFPLHESENNVLKWSVA